MINGSRNVFLMSVLPVTFGTSGLGVRVIHRFALRFSQVGNNSTNFCTIMVACVAMQAMHK